MTLQIVAYANEISEPFDVVFLATKSVATRSTSILDGVIRPPKKVLSESGAPADSR